MLPAIVSILIEFSSRNQTEMLIREVENTSQNYVLILPTDSGKTETPINLF